MNTEHDIFLHIAQGIGALLGVNLNSPKSALKGLAIFATGLAVSFYFTPVVLQLSVLTEWGVKTGNKTDYAVGFFLGISAMFGIRWAIKKFFDTDLNHDSGNGSDSNN